MIFKYLFSKNDISGFWALLADNLANIVIITGICKGIFKMSDEIVFGRIVPGIGISLFFGLLIYSIMAYKLAIAEKRDNVTALPYGISTPIMFVYLFSIMAPVYFKTSNPLLAWQAGIAAAFVGGIIEALGSIAGPYIKKHTPRAGMLGTLAGIAIVWIAVIPFAEIFENPLVGFISLGIILLGLIAGINLPFGIPAGLAAIILGTAIGFTNGSAKINFEGIGLNFPSIFLADLISGIKFIFKNPSILAIILPVEIYNFMETMNNVESAQTAGDKYNVCKTQLIDGIGTILTAFFGSPFPTTVYIGHPAYKRLGARSGYALGVGVVILVAGIFGVINFLYNLIPVAAVAPILIFVAIIITAQAFICVKPSHNLAVAIALVPHIADLVYKQLSNGINTIANFIPKNFKFPAEYLELSEMISNGQIPTNLKLEFLSSGIHISGLSLLSQGAIIIGLLWGAITAFILDCNYKKAAYFSFAAAILSATGFIHSPQVSLKIHSPLFWSYIIIGMFFYLCDTLKLKCQLTDFSEMLITSKEK